MTSLNVDLVEQRNAHPVVEAVEEAVDDTGFDQVLHPGVTPALTEFEDSGEPRTDDLGSGGGDEAQQILAPKVRFGGGGPPFVGVEETVAVPGHVTARGNRQREPGLRQKRYAELGREVGATVAALKADRAVHVKVVQ